MAAPVADPLLKYHVFGLALLLVLLGLGHEWVNPWLRYDRLAIEQGQWWRLVSCHLVHMNHWHMALNLSGFLLCWYFFSDLFTRSILWVWLLVSALTLGLLFYWVDTALGHYVGLSGILHGWLMIGLLLGLREQPGLHGLVLLLVVGRLVWEHLPSYDVYYMKDIIAGRVYVNSHSYGAAVGALLGCLFVFRRHRQSARVSRSEGQGRDV